MRLSPGDKLGHYEVLSLLGQGFPFDYVGPASRRFVVRARMLSNPTRSDVDPPCTQTPQKPIRWRECNESPHGH